MNWERSRFTVHSSKTEAHADAGIRVVPMFGELQRHFAEAFEQAEPGSVYCCPQYVNANQMYKKSLQKAIKLAGLTPWPKLFQNMRSSRETELAEEYPVQVVCAWIGNSPQVASKHYLQITEAHFQKAVQNHVQNHVHHTGQQGTIQSQAESEKAENLSNCDSMVSCGTACDRNSWAVLDLNQ